MNNDNIPQEKAPTENNSYYVVAESQILEDPRLTDELLVTFLHLSNFLKKDGYATCSDEWLSERRRCKIRNIQYQLEALEKAGYLWRETWKEGMYWKRRIWLSSKYAQYLIENQLEDEKFKKCLRNAKNCVIDLQNFAPSTGKKLQHNNKSTEQKKKTTTPTPSAPSSSSLPLFDKKRKYLQGVSDDIIEMVKSLYEKQKDSIKKPEAWITQCIKEKWYYQTPKEDPALRKKTNLVKAKEFVEKYPSYSRLSGDTLSFNTGRVSYGADLRSECHEFERILESWAFKVREIEGAKAPIFQA